MSMLAIEPRSILWGDFSASAKETLFRVWEDNRELLWAEQCWSFLSKYDLTRYSDEVSKCRVLIRLMSLAEIYREFCDRAWQEVYKRELVVWAGEIEVNRFRVAQCVGQSFEPTMHDDEEELFESALFSLMEEARREVRLVLKAEFGGDDYLFVSLWNTVVNLREDDDPEFESDPKQVQNGGYEIDKTVMGFQLESAEKAAPRINWLENADIILSEVTPDKMSAYEWIKAGMPQIY
jgi:hypothetical protein